MGQAEHDTFSCVTQNINMAESKIEGISSRLGKNCIHTLVEIAGPQTPNQVPKPDIEDEQKRWLIVGICLHSVISPILRTYIQPEIDKLYTSLVASDKIDSQVFPKKYKPTNRELNYEAINNNNTIPKLKGGKKDVPKYDFRVQNAVDFSKLFLQTSMAHYTGFDDSCDMSALLGIICNIDTFPVNVRNVAGLMRSDVRNKWAHSNFTEWDVIMYQDSFTKMYQLVTNLQLPQKDEANAVAELTKWQTTGMHLLQGTTIGLELLQTLKTETQSLGKYILEIVSQTDVSFKQISDAISDIENKIEKSELAIDVLKSDVDMTKTNVASQNNTIVKLESDMENVVTGIAKLEHGQEKTNQDIISIKDDLSVMNDNIRNNRTKIDQIETYMSSSRPHDKAYFYPPNRIHTFVAREDELSQLKDLFLRDNGNHELIVICGLGGTGKTSLAIEYSWEYQNVYTGGVFWMSAESNEALEDALQRLAIDIHTVSSNSKETLQKTLKWIGSIQEKWLLVIDNLDQDELTGNIKDLVFGSWHRVPSANIIITSRRESTQAEVDFSISASKCIILDVLTNVESKQFLNMRSDLHDENADLDELVVELGGLPLALEQAGAHIKVLKCSYGEYVRSFKKRRVKFLKSSKSVNAESKMRQTVNTTWHLNFEYVSKHAEEEDIGTSAVTVMEMAAFLYPDEIPIEILNSGLPSVPCEDIVEFLSESIGAKQIVEVLCRFSLFQRSYGNSFSVHRLVQDVIRANINDKSHKNMLLKCAARMIHKALKSTKSPVEALKDENIGRTSLQLWSKLALHANTLSKFLFDFAKKNTDYGNLCINEETVNILQASAIYHSVFQRQDEALEAQNQMLKLLPAISLPDKEYAEVMGIKIPLLANDRTIIQSSIMTVTKESDATEHGLPLDTEDLRVKGKSVYYQKKYHEAVQCFTEAIIASTDNTDPRLLLNRSITYLRLSDYSNALDDANKCIEIDPRKVSAYVCKAYAVAGLMRIGQLDTNWESAGMAAAAVAGHFNTKTLLKYKMRVEYPIVRYKEVKNENELEEEIGSLLNMTHTTLLLKKGQYTIEPARKPLTRSVQLIGIEDGVHVKSTHVIAIRKVDKSWFSVDVVVEPKMNIYFENITFPENTPQIFIFEDANVTFYRCNFSNGHKGCESFPKCNGIDGCANKDPNECKQNLEKRVTKIRTHAGIVGFPGISVGPGGSILVDACVFDRCGGGGVLCDGENARMYLKNSIFRNMRQMGVESRNHGFMSVDSCIIANNQTHGVAVGPNGKAEINNCTIYGNKCGDGIWCGCNTEGEDKPSVCKIWNSVIYQNGESGVSLEGGSCFLFGNRILENWFWGVTIKSRSTACFSNNDIFDNKCGGVRIGVNYSAPVEMDGNTIRDHSGPAIHSETDDKGDLSSFHVPYKFVKECLRIENEVKQYTISPFITSRNVFTNNNKSILLHPQKLYSELNACSFCHAISKKLLCCSACKQAQYCSKGCQNGHWSRHKHLCKLLQKQFTVDMPLAQTKSYQEFYQMDFTPKLKPIGDLPGYGEGKMPDKRSEKKFIVKIQSGADYDVYNPDTWMRLYDQSQQFLIMFQNRSIYHVVMECGVLAGTQMTVKKIFCWASFLNKGNTLRLYTDTLPPFQSW